jgi:hypothetical protein
MLYRPTYETVHYVAHNMRAADRQEIYSLYDVETPFLITQGVMSQPEVAFLAGRERPIAVFGAMKLRATTWAAFCFATDEFPKVALEVTKYIRKVIQPDLFLSRGARRVEADSHFQHIQAHKWLRLLGAEQEGVRREYNKHGEPYITFALTLSDFERERGVTSPDGLATMVGLGDKVPGLAHP